MEQNIVCISILVNYGSEANLVQKNGLDQGATAPEDTAYGMVRVNRTLCRFGAKEECKNGCINAWIKDNLMAFHVHVS